MKVDFFDMKLKEGDIILMCTDGLTNMVEDEEIKMVVKSSADVASIAENLIAKANRNGGIDNIGVVVIEPFS